jgi:hypothetical protein
MLRRYLIVNGTTTAVLYGAIWAFVPPIPNLMHVVSSTIDMLAQSPLLGPVINRIILVTSGL